MLLVPNGEDWWFAGKVLNALHRGLRSHRRGPTPAIPKEEQQRLLRDVLIARSAKRVNATVVTYNSRDFARIRRFCSVPVAEPDDVL
jgi:predicted nucleic acid-binding protein